MTTCLIHLFLLGYRWALWYVHTVLIGLPAQTMPTLIDLMPDSGLQSD